MDKIEIIETLLLGYVENPKMRAMEYGIIPRYKTQDGRFCPIGAAVMNISKYDHIIGPFYKILKQFYEDHPWINKNLIVIPPGLLYPLYDGHCYAFWKEIQAFHDNNNYFLEKGLSLKGKLAFETLKSKWEPMKHKNY